MTFFILFNKEALEKMIISSCSNIFLVYENTNYTDIFIVRRDCFPKFSNISISRKGDIFLVFIQKRCSFICFRYSEKIRKCDIFGLRKCQKIPKIPSFRLFSRIYTIRKDVILCSDSPYFFHGYRKNSLSKKNSFFCRLCKNV